MLCELEDELLLSFIENVQANNFSEVESILESVTPAQATDLINENYGISRGIREYCIPGIPLHLALYHLNKPMVALFLKYGADLEITDNSDEDRSTPLHTLCSNNLESSFINTKVEILDLLLQKGVKYTSFDSVAVFDQWLKWSNQHPPKAPALMTPAANSQRKKRGHPEADLAEESKYAQENLAAHVHNSPSKKRALQK